MLGRRDRRGVGAFATTMPRLVAASTSTLSTPTPARPITFSLVGAIDEVGGELGRGADDDRVVVADPLGQIAVYVDVDGIALAQELDARVGDLLQTRTASHAALVRRWQRRPAGGAQDRA